MMIGMLFLVAAMAAGGDDEGACIDSKILPRLTGCTIESCSRKAYDAAPILLGRNAGGELVSQKEGATEELGYACPAEMSGLQIVRNVQGAFERAGFAVRYLGKDGFDAHAITGQKGASWLTVRTNSESRYLLTTVVEKGLVQEMAMAVEQTGRVAVYGIEFDSGKATLRPEAVGALESIHELLTANPQWRMSVEGHTDDVGGAAANQTLSEMRARAVVRWLEQKGVESTRLEVKGWGSSRPLEPKATAEGRAKNRRVELVRLP